MKSNDLMTRMTGIFFCFVFHTDKLIINNNIIYIM